MPPRLRRSLAAAGLSLLLGGLGAVFTMVWIEDSFIYFPAPGGAPAGPGEDVFIDVADGERLHARQLLRPGADRTLLYLHGNAGNLEGRAGILALLSSLDANLLALDYRGYGLSTGRPSERGLYADALAAHDFLTARVPASSIVVLGESLGGGVACELALRRQVGGLVLLSTFTSIPDMARISFPALLPVHLLVRTRFDNLAKVSEIAAPKLLVHSRADELIPFRMAEQLYDAARGPKRKRWLDSGGHNETFLLQRRPLLDALSSFMRELE